MKFHPLLTAALLSASVGVAFAETATKPVSLDDCVALALKRNLGIRISSFGPRFSRLTLSSDYAPYDPSFTAGVSQSFRSFPPTPSGTVTNSFVPPSSTSWSDNYSAGLGGYLPTGLQYSFSGNVTRGQSTLLPADVTGAALYSPGANVNLTQPLLKNMWIDATRLNISFDKLGVKTSEEVVRAQILDTLLSVEQSYYGLISALENVRVQQKALEVSERFLFETRKRVEVGSLAPLDAKQAESEVARNKAALVTALQNAGDAERLLKGLIDDDFAASADIMLTPTAKLENIPSVQSRANSWGRAFEFRPDYHEQKFGLLQQKLNLRFTRNQMYPQLDLTGSYGVGGNELTLGGSILDLGQRAYPNYSWGLRFSIPLSNLSARNAYKQAKIKQEQLLLQFKQLEQTIMIAVDNDIRAIEGYREGMVATKEARVYAEAALDAEQKKLESGKSTNYQVLQLQRDLTTAEKNEIDALANYNKALAQLAHDEGSTLDRLKVNLDIH